MNVATGQMWETFGTYGSWAYLAFCGFNGIVNMSWDELDFNTLFEAIECPQNVSLVGGMGVKLPPQIQTFFSSMRGATSIDTEEAITPEGEPTMDEEIYGEKP